MNLKVVFDFAKDDSMDSVHRTREVREIISKMLLLARKKGNIMVTFAQFEREQTSERVSINCHSRAVRGYVNGGRAIFGFDRHAEKRGLLVVNEDEAKKVKRIFEIFIEEGTRAKTIKRLHELNIYPNRTLKNTDSDNPTQWTTQTLGNILNQSAYIGYKEVNKSYRNEDQDSLKPWQKYQMVKASWPAIIDEKLFYDAQRILETSHLRERERLQSANKNIFFLSHILTCGECSKALVGQSSRGRDGTIHRYYYHSRKLHDDNCTLSRKKADIIEEKVLSFLKEGLQAAGYFEKLEGVLAANAKSQGQNYQDELEIHKVELEKINKEIAGIWKQQSSGFMQEGGLKLISARLEELANEKEKREKAIANLKSKTLPIKSASSEVEFVRQNLKDLIKGWSKASNAMKKRLFQRAIKRIIVTKEEIKITFWLSADERGDANHSGSSGENNAGAQILEFRRNSRRGDSANADHNELVGGVLIRKNGSEEWT